MRKLALFLIAAFCSLAAGSVRAQDSAQKSYDAPQGMAYVRFINAGDETKPLNPVIRGKAYKPLKRGVMGPYYPVEEGKAGFGMDQTGASETLVAGAYYTVFLRSNTLTVLKDTPTTNFAKDVVVLYNFSDTPDLTLGWGEEERYEIVPFAQPGENSHKELAAIPMNLEVYTQYHKKVLDIGPVDLKRNGITAIIVMVGDDGHPKVTVADAELDTTQN
jgi:hypothetical protein